MSGKTKGDLVIEFLAGCKRQTELENELASVIFTNNKMENVILNDYSLIPKIRNGGISHQKEVLRYDDELCALRIDAIAEVLEFDKVLSVEQLGALGGS